MKDKLSFPTRKLKGALKPITTRVRDVPGAEKLTVYGVTNQEGVTLTGKAASEDVSNYIVVGPNQFVYNPYRVNVGSIGLTSFDFAGIVSPAYVVFEAGPEIVSGLLFHYLKSSIGQKLIRWYGDRGGVRSAMRFTDLVNIDYPAITFDEQQAALLAFEVVAKAEADLQQEFTHQAILLTRLRQAVLREAVQGQLVPQDATDEPALALLDRIRVEKQRLMKEEKLRADKPLPPLSETEMPYEVPQGWVWCRAIDVMRSLVGHAFKSQDFSKEGIRLLRNINVSPGFINWVEVARVPNEFREKFADYELKSGDIVLGLDRPIISSGLKVARIKDVDLPALLLQRVAKFSPILISPDYLQLWFDSHLVIKALDPGRSKGIPHISHKDVEKIGFPLPPLPEQRRIVAKVTELLTYCTELEDELGQAQQAAKTIHAAALREAFMGPVGAMVKVEL